MEKITQKEFERLLKEQLKKAEGEFKNPPLTVNGDIEIDKIEYE